MNASTGARDHERKDVNVPALFTISFLLLLSCIAIFIVVTLMLRYFQAHEPAVTAGQVNIPTTRAEERPQPLLQVQAGAGLAALRAAENADVNYYDEIDRNGGRVRLTIDGA